MATATVSTGRSAKTSSILLKTSMAISGLIFVGYVVAHMYGNLKIFAGTDAFNDYAEHLRELGEPILPYEGLLWIIRVVLVASLVVHSYAGYSLWKRAGSARKTRYVVTAAARQLWVSRAMRWGGTALLLFIAFHLLHFTTNTIKLNGDYADPASRLVSSFEIWWAVGIYALAVAALGMHLWHGIWAAGMTLGLNASAKAAQGLHSIAAITAVIVVVGFLAPPFAILFGFVPSGYAS